MASAAAVTKHAVSAMEESAFSRFREQSVDLTSDHVAAGRLLRDVIIEEIEAMSGLFGFPLVLHGESFGAGSFGRKTACQPLDDIDIYTVLNGGGGVMHDDGTTYAVEGSTPGPLLNDLSLRTLFGGWVSADLVVKRVADRLGALPRVQRYGGEAGVSEKGKCAFVRFGSLNVDITPVLWVRFRNAIDRYYMPVGRGSFLWKRTNPKEDQRRLSEQNQKQMGMVIPSIRLVKWWNQHRNGERLKSILVEVLVERALYPYTLEGYGQAMHVIFGSLPRLLENRCDDPTGLGPPLDTNLSEWDRRMSIEAATAAHSCAFEAAKWIAAGNHVGAVSSWEPVFPLLRALLPPLKSRV